MKIENHESNERIQPTLSKVQGAGERRDVEGAVPRQETPVDQVELSDAAKAMRQARQVLAGLPEVRLEKVNELQTKIEGGLYNVRGEQVAAKMLGQGFFDQLI